MNVPIRCAILLLTAFALFRPAAAAAQHFPSDEALTARIRGVVEAGQAKGIVLGVMEADGSTRVVAYGDPGPGARPLGPSSVFEIGSLNKVFTATLLADMVARGEVSLEDPVGRYLPEGVAAPSRGREITLLDLATHYSGLPRIPDNLAPADSTNPYADYTVEKLYAFLATHQPRRDVGAEFEYSNVGMGLLGHVLARAAGRSYEDLIRERILEPLGMGMTRIAPTPEMEAWMTRGHNARGALTSPWDVPAMPGAGGLRSNALDMLTFLAANTGPAASPIERAMRETHPPRRPINARTDVGLNWYVRKNATRRIVYHTGATGGYRTMVAFDPASGVGVVLLTNSAQLTDLGLVYDLIDPPVQRTEVQLAPETLRRYAGEYQLTPDLVLAVTMENGALFTQATGQPRHPLFAESETKFFLRAFDAQVTFTTDAAGAVTGLVLHQNGADRPAPRVR